MKKQSLNLLIAFGLTIAAIGYAAPASADCENTCVTMAIPREAGIQTRLDGTADATLWPPSHDLRTIKISALNNQNVGCDVTIEDVRQDEAPRVSGSGTTIDDAVGCSNDGKTSSVSLRSDRAADGNGRFYHISFKLKDPSCGTTERADELVVAVPQSEPTLMTMKAVDDDEGNLTASYAGPSLQCTPAKDDRLSMR